MRCNPFSVGVVRLPQEARHAAAPLGHVREDRLKTNAAAHRVGIIFFMATSLDKHFLTRWGKGG